MELHKVLLVPRLRLFRGGIILDAGKHELLKGQLGLLFRTPEKICNESGDMKEEQRSRDNTWLLQKVQLKYGAAA